MDQTDPSPTWLILHIAFGAMLTTASAMLLYLPDKEKHARWSILTMGITAILLLFLGLAFFYPAVGDLRDGVKTGRWSHCELARLRKFFCKATWVAVALIYTGGLAVCWILDHGSSQSWFKLFVWSGMFPAMGVGQIYRALSAKPSPSDPSMLGLSR